MIEQYLHSTEWPRSTRLSARTRGLASLEPNSFGHLHYSVKEIEALTYSNLQSCESYRTTPDQGNCEVSMGYRPGLVYSDMVYKVRQLNRRTKRYVMEKYNPLALTHQVYHHDIFLDRKSKRISPQLLLLYDLRRLT